MVTPATRFCAHCGTSVSPGATFCVHCGATLAAQTTSAGVPAPSPLPAGVPMHTPSPAPTYAPAPAYDPTRPTQGVAIAALLLNILIWPGLGSLIAKRNEGWAQGFIFLLGIPLAFILVGIPMLIGAWIWGIVTGVDLLQKANPR